MWNHKIEAKLEKNIIIKMFDEWGFKWTKWTF